MSSMYSMKQQCVSQTEYVSVLMCEGGEIDISSFFGSRD